MLKAILVQMAMLGVLLSCGFQQNLSTTPQCTISPADHLASNRVPEGSAIHRGSTVEGQGEAISFVSVITDLEAHDLRKHYDKNALDAGWSLVDEGETDGYSWSNWKYLDKCNAVWNGSITVKKDISDPEPFVTIRIVIP
jgi:hypothetical protein